MPSYTETLTGTAGDDVLNSTVGQNSYMRGLAGDDFLDGLDGDDGLEGGDGADSLDGGDGDDMLWGNVGEDALFGGEGNDMLYGEDDGSGDYLAGYYGNDTLFGYAADTLNGGPGDDMLVAYHTSVVIQEGPGNGNDLLQVSLNTVGSTFTLDAEAEIETVWILGPNALTFYGSDTDNHILLQSAPANNALYGRGGNDSLVGSNQVETLNGGTGNDTLEGGGGADLLVGGKGDDVYKFTSDTAYSLATIVEWNNQGSDTLVFDYSFGTNTLVLPTHIENYTGGAGFLQTDRLTVTGNDGDNVVTFSTAGTYYVDAGAGNDTVILSHWAAIGGLIRGEAGNDFLSGGSYADDMHGGTGSDTLLGNSGDDILYGNGGNDSLSGGNGMDTLVGGWGSDTLTGGAHSDTFVFDVALGSSGVDTITDFTSGVDKLQIALSVTNLKFAGNLWVERFTTGSAATEANDRFIFDSNTGNLYYDADGSGAGAQVLFATLSGGATLAASDIVIL